MKFLLLLFFIPALLFSSIGNVAAVTGKAKIERNTKNIVIKYGIAIEEKDKIVTQNNSKVQIMLKDNTIITIGENSKYSFTEYKFNTKADSKVKMKLDHGFFRVITGKIGKIAPERFKVQSKSATIGIRGTHFYGLVRKKVEEYGCIRGEISVLTKKMRKINLNTGEMVSLKNGVWKRGIIGQGHMRQLNTSIGGSTSSVVNQTQQNTLIQGKHYTPTPPPTPPPSEEF